MIRGKQLASLKYSIVGSPMHLWYIKELLEKGVQPNLESHVKYFVHDKKSLLAACMCRRMFWKLDIDVCENYDIDTDLEDIVCSEEVTIDSLYMQMNDTQRVEWFGLYSTINPRIT
jgi:hypothetical protein